MVPFDSLSKSALEINLFGIARLDSTMLPYMVTLVTIYGNRCMGGRERSSEDHVIGVVFDEESHGNIRFYSFGRRYTVLKQTPRMTWRSPVPSPLLRYAKVFAQNGPSDRGDRRGSRGGSSGQD